MEESGAFCETCSHWKRDTIRHPFHLGSCLCPLEEGETFVSFTGYTKPQDSCSRHKMEVKKGERYANCIEFNDKEFAPIAIKYLWMEIEQTIPGKYHSGIEWGAFETVVMWSEPFFTIWWKVTIK